MPTAQDFLNEENQEEVTTEEEVTEENAQQEQETDRIASLEAELKRLNAQLASQAPKPTEQAPQGFKLSKEQAEALAKDPQKMIELFEYQNQAMRQQFEGRFQQQHWDERAYKDFPSLNTDKKYQEAVTKEIQTLVSTGAMNKDNPQLLYQAARLATLNYKPAAGGKGPMKTANALPSGSRTKPSGQSEGEDPRKDPNYQMMKMAGWDDKRIKEARARHKDREVESRTAPNGRTRRVIALGRG